MWYQDTQYPRVFSRVDGWSTDPRILGRHSLVSELRYTNTLGLASMGLDNGIYGAFHVLCSICYMIVCYVNYIHGKMYIGKYEH